jgi:hypothetical protein
MKPSFDEVRCFGGPLHGQTVEMRTTVMAHDTPAADQLQVRRRFYKLRSFVIRTPEEGSLCTGEPMQVAYAYVCPDALPIDDPAVNLEEGPQHAAAHAVFGSAVFYMSELGAPGDRIADGLRLKDEVVDACRAWFAALDHGLDAENERRAMVRALDADREFRRGLEGSR